MNQNTPSVSEPLLAKRVPVGARGQIVLPVEMRRALGLEQGDQVTLRLEGGRVLLEPQKQVHTRLRGKYATPGRSLSEELLTERRQEAGAKEW